MLSAVIMNFWLSSFILLTFLLYDRLVHLSLFCTYLQSIRIQVIPKVGIGGADSRAPEQHNDRDKNWSVSFRSHTSLRSYKRFVKKSRFCWNFSREKVGLINEWKSMSEVLVKWWPQKNARREQFPKTTALKLPNLYQNIKKKLRWVCL